MFFVESNLIYSTPRIAGRTDATNIDVFALWRFSGRASKPGAVIKVDIVKPRPAMSEASMTVCRLTPSGKRLIL